MGVRQFLFLFEHKRYISNLEPQQSTAPLGHTQNINLGLVGRQERIVGLSLVFVHPQ